MPETLTMPDGTPVDLPEAERDFHAAMAAPASDEPEHPAPPKVDQDAKPKRSPTKSSKPRTTKQAPKAKQAAAETPQAIAERRTDGVKGAVQIGAMVTAGLHMRTGEKSWLADTYTITDAAEPLADAVVQTCVISPAFARAIDKVTEVGPYAALATVGLQLVVQLASNHEVGMARAMGGKSADEVIAAHQDDEVSPDAGTRVAA